jgi:hypothetical protein
MHRILNFVFLALGGIGVTACGGSTMSSSGSIETEPTTIQSLVDTNEASFSNALSVLARDTSAGMVMSSDRKEVTVTPSKNAAGVVVYNVTAFGRTVTFEPSDLNSSGSSFSKTLPDGTKVFMWSFDGSWDKIQQGTSKFKYMVRFSTSDIADGVNTRAYGVMGTPTAVAQLPTSGSATYFAERGMRADAYLTTDPDQRVRLYGDVNLDVDFGKSQISGEFNNLTDEDGTESVAVLKLKPAAVRNGTFATTLSIENGASDETLKASAVNGRFYGDEAQEVGGDLSFTTSTAGSQIVAAGAFGAKKQ